MAEGDWTIQEVRLAGSSLVLRIPAAPNLNLLPGQFFQAYAPGFDEPAATSLFLAQEHSSSWDLTGSIPPNWNPGTRLRWRGPLGHGFTLPVKVRKAAFVPWLDHGLTLLPLVHQALSHQAAVVWYSHQVPDWLPHQVEVLTPDSLPEAQMWADYIALTCDLVHFASLRQALVMDGASSLKCEAEVLVKTPLICGGSGECGVCSVKTRRGWTLACKDGPVFAFEELEE